MKHKVALEIVAAMLQALEDAGLPHEKEALEAMNVAKCGILIGTAMGGMQTFSTAVEDLTVKVGPLPGCAHHIQSTSPLAAVQSSSSDHQWLPGRCMVVIGL